MIVRRSINGYQSVTTHAARNSAWSHRFCPPLLADLPALPESDRAPSLVAPRPAMADDGPHLPAPDPFAPLTPLPQAAAIVAAARDLAGARPAAVAAWFDRAMDLAIPANDGTIESQRRTADAIRRRAKAANTI